MPALVSFLIGVTIASLASTIVTGCMGGGPASDNGLGQLSVSEVRGEFVGVWAMTYPLLDGGAVELTMLNDGSWSVYSNGDRSAGVHPFSSMALLSGSWEIANNVETGKTGKSGLFLIFAVKQEEGEGGRPKYSLPNSFWFRIIAGGGDRMVLSMAGCDSMEYYFRKRELNQLDRDQLDRQ